MPLFPDVLQSASTSIFPQNFSDSLGRLDDLIEGGVYWIEV